MSKTHWEPSAGERFGRWTATGEPSVRRGRWEHAVPVVCDCGRRGYVVTKNLRNGHSRSCGCLSIALSRIREPLRAHPTNPNRIGNTPEQLAINRARGRCYNPRNKSFANYGGRGITVCDRWRGPHGSANFVADMGLRPSPRHSLDRIDVNGNYEPSNCRWATQEQQDNNKRATVMVEHDGRRLPAASWAGELGIKAKTITARVRRGFRGARALAPVLAAAARGGK